jgi:hypothetical protein
MNTNTPLLPRTKNMRWAAALNLFLPGAGLFYLGRRKTGAVLAVVFLFCLVAALGTFLTGYIHYLNVVLGSDLMQEGQLEQLKDVFHKRWLVGLGIAGVSLQVISMVAMARARPKQGEADPHEPHRPDGK